MLIFFVIQNIDEALIDTIYTIKKEFTQDSLYFHSVEQAISRQSFGMINRHLPAVYISSTWTTGPYGLWDISPEYSLPFTLKTHLIFSPIRLLNL